MSAGSGISLTRFCLRGNSPHRLIPIIAWKDIRQLCRCYSREIRSNFERRLCLFRYSGWGGFIFVAGDIKLRITWQINRTASTNNSDFLYKSEVSSPSSFWECLQRDDGAQGNVVKVAYLLRDKGRLGKDCKHIFLSSSDLRTDEIFNSSWICGGRTWCTAGSGGCTFLSLSFFSKA